MSTGVRIGVLGGSGLYEIAGLRGLREERVRTPFGEPSEPPLVGQIGAIEVVFIPRHGRGHRLLPSEINYRANIHALRQLEVERVVSVSAVGSMREAIQPGDIVLPDQYVDRTVRRESTFFGGGVVGHVAFADPVCPVLFDALGKAAEVAGYLDAAGADRAAPGDPLRPPRVWRGGTYVCIEGPQFSTRAESLLYRSWGVDVIGMSAVTEAKLAREAEICFATLALSTDYDCWHPEEQAVTATSVVETLARNIAGARRILEGVLPRLGGPRTCPCARAAAGAIMTARHEVPAEARERLTLLFGRYL